MKNKRGMELPVNMLVIIIVSIVIFGMGIAFFARIYQTAQDYQEQSEQQALKEIENYLINPNEKVAIPVNTKDIKRTGYQTFGLIINNAYSEEEKTFDIKINNIKCSDGINPNTAELTTDNIPTLTIPANSVGESLISIKTEDTNKGQCIIPINVSLDKNTYGIEVITLTIQ